ncbi:MAG: cell division control protein Cdc6 [Candidatus Aenigmatarchaeota archaeon]|nr:MAG: cell division control protein Cdc6 [Candidatus Aenigmarchaeota archaeon]RLJ06538.1 MAG: cell division control protein Cdc6 [Candidatus Aenigmarchaeota archaeon]RLJ07748.1 MAG: cell division control protein Cdc6 [Candidatus Aenigmarchaeota archaeon]
MSQISLKDIFNNYVTKNPIFKNKETLSIKFTPENIPHREKQIKQLALILAPLLRNEKPSNIFIYGKTGTGKTLVTKKVTDSLLETSEQTNNNIKIIYVNCKMRGVTDTEYRLLAQLVSEFGESVPYTGLPTNEVYQKFFSILNKVNNNIVIVLDEIDYLIKKIGDSVLYNLTRINQELTQAKITVIGISNNISFIENLDPRVKSSLSEEEIIFPPYNALELKDILVERALLAFNQEAISDGVISKCAALAAQEHGDARKALDLIRVAGEIAERQGEKRIKEEHVDLAQEKLDMDRTLEIIKTQPKQSQVVMNAILIEYKKDPKNVQTGSVYDTYVELCKKTGLDPLTQRRVSDLISEFEMYGILNANVISKGRYGRTRIITLTISNTVIKKIEEYFSREA